MSKCSKDTQIAWFNMLKLGSLYDFRFENFGNFISKLLSIIAPTVLMHELIFSEEVASYGSFP